jgi:hypothetical protein
MYKRLITLGGEIGFKGLWAGLGPRIGQSLFSRLDLLEQRMSAEWMCLGGDSDDCWVSDVIQTRWTWAMADV